MPATIFGKPAVVSSLYQAYFGAAAGNGTYTNNLAFATSGSDVGLSNAYATQFSGTSSAVLAAQVLTNMGINTPALVTALTALFNGYGVAARGQIVLNLTSLLSGLEGDATWGTAARAWNQQVAQDNAYSQVTSNVTDAAVTAGSGSISLTTGLDNKFGTAGDDVFTANIFDNQNTFQSGDTVNGGAGTDTLNAELGDSSSFAIRAITNSVEKVFFTSQSTNANGSSGNNNVDVTGDMNTVDAEKMVGVTQWWSTESRADLKIEDVRILDNQITKDITIGLRDTDPGSIGEDYYYNGTGSGEGFNYNTNKVDFEVYFSPESLRPASKTDTSQLTLIITNPLRVSDGYDAAKPLDNVPYTKVQIIVNGAPVIISLDLTKVDTYDQLYVALTTAFAASTDPVVKNIVITQVKGGYPYFSTDGQPRAADSFVLTCVGGTLLEKTPTASSGWLVDGALPSDNAFTSIVQQGGITSDNPLITSTIILDNVGREDEAGSLTIGSMSTHGGVERFEITVENNGDNAYSGTPSGSWLSHMNSTNNTLREVTVKNADAGIDNPDYLFLGTNMDQSGNNLWNMQDWPGGLGKPSEIYPQTTSLLNPDGLYDVRLFDASAMKGDVFVGAWLGEDVIRKYQKPTDSAVDAKADDVHFIYKTGAGNDSVNLVIDGYAAGSQTVSGIGDFDFLVDGGAGNDNLMVTLNDDVTSGSGQGNYGFHAYDNWYNNQKINKNVTINGGDGNDTIQKPGAGDTTINGGAGDDNIYSDNTGGQYWWGYGRGEDSGDIDFYNNDNAAWVFNTRTPGVGNGGRSSDVYNLGSDTAATVKGVNAQLQVTFMGFESAKITIANSVGSLTDIAITDLAINQAIKEAINTNATLNKLVIAEDGPGRSLIVRSLIDGHMQEYKSGWDSLSVKFSTVALTTAQTAAGVIPFSTAATPALLDGYYDGKPANFGSTDLFGYDLTTGDNGWAPTDNRITGGTGNDVIVLSTTESANGYTPVIGDTAHSLDDSNETLVYSGFANGNDTIVNFNSDWVPAGTTIYSAASGKTEVITLTFSASDGSPAAQTIIFDGATVTLSAPLGTQGVIPAADVTLQFGEQFSSANWSVVGYDTAKHTVQLTYNTSGAVTDVVAGDLTGTYFGSADGNGSVSVVTNTQGVTNGVVGDYAEFTVSFTTATTAANAAGTFTFDGNTVAYAEGDGSLTLAQKLAAPGAFTNYTVGTPVVSGTDVSVTFYAKAPGVGTVPTAADFDLGIGNVIEGSVTVPSGGAGSASTGTIIVTPVPAGPADGYDMIDFSGYGATAVAVNGVAVLNTLPTTGKYIDLVESTTNDGSYTINQVDLGSTTATTDDVVTLIGVADFGIEQTFHAVNFILS